MVSKKIKILFFISISIFFTYLLLLITNYSEISELVTTHINIKGEVDSQGSKKNLWIATTVNLAVLLLIGYLIKKPHLANYPVEITEKNKSTVYNNMRLFLSVLAIITSCSFAYMIFKAINYTDYYFYIIGALVIIPIITILFLIKKDE